MNQPSSKYMMTAAHVKDHRMTDPRWTMGDKVDQYKKIVGLYARDQRVIRKDTKNAQLKQHQELQSLRNKIHDERTQLKLAIVGDTQGLRNALSEHRELQLAYQHLPPEEVVENIKQINHKKKREYDQLRFKKRKEAKILLQLKVELAEMQDRLKCGVTPKEEDQAQFLTGKLQDAELKRNVAITIQRNFKNILDIMKKDSLYFDAILASLKQDSVQQAGCLYRAIQLGQLAKEYLDDRVQDYNILEKAIKKSMKIRQRSIRVIKAQIKDTSSHLKFLLSRESGTELTQTMRKSPSEMELQRNVDSLDAILKFIQTTTYVCHYQEILPRMEDQRTQYLRLRGLCEETSKIRDRMLKKRNHAELMYDSLSTSMAGTTFKYMAEKKKFQVFMKEVNKRISLCQSKFDDIGDVFLVIRTSVHQLCEMTKCVTGGIPLTAKHQQIDQVLMIPEKIETEIPKLLQILTGRYQILMSKYNPLDLQFRSAAADLYQHAASEASSRAHRDEFARTSISLEVDGDIEDPSIPTREDIKKRSNLIVEDCAKRDDDQPIVLLPIRGKTF